MMKRWTALLGLLCVAILAPASAQTPASAPLPITVVKAGRVIDPETGTAAVNQVIVIEGERFKAIGANLPVPPGATVIDLSRMTVLPGLVDAHTHMGMTYKEQPENNYYYLTYITDSTPLRAI
ncbi:MAG: hypothetical protein NTY02_09500, partial [Acidobacteria bacterium]|nr:hypothetical protein [Acidobacteriota bacterium]